MGNKDLEIETTGPWPLVTFWETVALSATNDLYFENYVKRNHLDLRELRAEGDRRLDAKIKTLQHHPETCGRHPGASRTRPPSRAARTRR